MFAIQHLKFPFKSERCSVLRKRKKDYVTQILIIMKCIEKLRIFIKSVTSKFIVSLFLNIKRLTRETLKINNVINVSYMKFVIMITGRKSNLM